MSFKGVTPARVQKSETISNSRKVMAVTNNVNPIDDHRLFLAGLNTSPNPMLSLIYL